MKKALIASTVVIAGAFGLGLAAWAFQHGPWEHGPRGHEPRDIAPRLLALLESDRVKTELSLTDQQVQRLRQIIVDAEKSSIKTRADMALRGVELRELLRPDNPDRDAVLKKVQEISSLRGEMMKHHVEALLAAKTVLTPEQQKKVRTFIESRHGGEFWRGMMGPHHHMPGPPSEAPGNAPKPPAE